MSRPSPETRHSRLNYRTENGSLCFSALLLSRHPQRDQRMLSIRNFVLPTPRNIFCGAMIAAAVSVFATGARAAMTISKAPTALVSCTSNSCYQTGEGNAVLNVSQLQTLLASSSVQVVGRSLISVDAEITWANASALTLNALEITINQPIVVAGAGGLTVEPAAFSQVVFGAKGNITFWSTSSNLNIGVYEHTTSYTLVNSIAMLASDIAAKPSGNYALANSYNASSDGTYASSPIPSFSGNFIGLNNTISHLSISDKVAGHQVGLFGTLLGESEILWLKLKDTYVRGGNDSQVGALIGVNSTFAQVRYSSADGSVSTGTGTKGGNPGAIAGGLVGLNYGTIEDSYTTGTVKGGKNAIIGGIAGEDGVTGIYNLGGDVGAVYSTMTVTLASGACTGCTIGQPENSAGGVVGVNYGGVYAAYATGPVTGGSFANLGGLIGWEDSTASAGNYAVSDDYSTSTVTGETGSSVGGAIGFDVTPGYIRDVYWDTTTSGITNSNQGTGNIANDAGITGLTTAQLQSGLPAGFSSDPEIWGESPSINGGLPYLLAIPPNK